MASVLFKGSSKVVSSILILGTGIVRLCCVVKEVRLNLLEGSLKCWRSGRSCLPSGRNPKRMEGATCPMNGQGFDRRKLSQWEVPPLFSVQGPRPQGFTAIGKAQGKSCPGAVKPGREPLGPVCLGEEEYIVLWHGRLGRSVGCNGLQGEPPASSP